MIEGAINKITEPFGSCRGTYCYLQRGGIIGQIGFRLEAIYKPHNGRQGGGFAGVGYSNIQWRTPITHRHRCKTPANKPYA